jgi:NADH-quinone oxidoreductase subunit C
MVIERLKECWADDLICAEVANGENVVVIERDRAPALMRLWREDEKLRLDFLTDITAVDWIGRKPRFEVVYHLYSFSLRHRLRIKIPVNEEEPWVYSVTSLWKAADWLERECYDMFGIRFEGHPDLRRILLYDSFVGHPLRKDYPVTKRQPLVEEVDPIIHPRPQSR